MLTFHVVSAVSTPKPALQKFPEYERRLRPKPLLSSRRAVLFTGKDGFIVDTGITTPWTLWRWEIGFPGPAVIDAPNTTIPHSPGAAGLEVDEYLQYGDRVLSSINANP